MTMQRNDFMKRLSENPLIKEEFFRSLHTIFKIAASFDLTLSQTIAFILDHYRIHSVFIPFKK